MSEISAKEVSGEQAGQRRLWLPKSVAAGQHKVQVRTSTKDEPEQRPLSGREQMLLLTLTDQRDNETGLAWLSERLAYRAGYSYKNLTRSVAMLVEAGVVEWERQPRQHHRGQVRVPDAGSEFVKVPVGVLWESRDSQPRWTGADLTAAVRSLLALLNRMPFEPEVGTVKQTTNFTRHKIAKDAGLKVSEYDRGLAVLAREPWLSKSLPTWGRFEGHLRQEPRSITIRWQDLDVSGWGAENLKSQSIESKNLKSQSIDTPKPQIAEHLSLKSQSIYLSNNGASIPQIAEGYTDTLSSETSTTDTLATAGSLVEPSSPQPQVEHSPAADDDRPRRRRQHSNGKDYRQNIAVAPVLGSLLNWTNETVSELVSSSFVDPFTSMEYSDRVERYLTDLLAKGWTGEAAAEWIERHLEAHAEQPLTLELFLEALPPQGGEANRTYEMPQKVVRQKVDPLGSFVAVLSQSNSSLGQRLTREMGKASQEKVERLREWLDAGVAAQGEQQVVQRVVERASRTEVGNLVSWLPHLELQTQGRGTGRDPNEQMWVEQRLSQAEQPAEDYHEAQRQWAAMYQ